MVQDSFRKISLTSTGSMVKETYTSSYPETEKFYSVQSKTRGEDLSSYLKLYSVL